VSNVDDMRRSWLRDGYSAAQQCSSTPPRGKLSVLALRVCGVQCSGVEVLTRGTLVCNGTALYNRLAVQSKGGNFFLAACGDVAVGRVEWCSVDKRCTDFWSSFCEFRVWAGRTSVTCLGLGHSRAACPVVVVPGRARYYHGPGDSIQHSMVVIECLLNVCVCAKPWWVQLLLLCNTSPYLTACRRHHCVSQSHAVLSTVAATSCCAALSTHHGSHCVQLPLLYHICLV